MRQPEERREYADSTLLELALSDIFDSVAAGRSVPLSRDERLSRWSCHQRWRKLGSAPLASSQALLAGFSR